MIVPRALSLSLASRGPFSNNETQLGSGKLVPMKAKTKPTRTLPPALAKRARTMTMDKKKRLATQGRSLLALVRDKRRVIAMSFYEMGQSLAGLADAQVYGALGYASFEAMLHAELEMSASQAERLMATALRLGEDQAADLGYEKSLAVASALALPGSKLAGKKLSIGRQTLDTSAVSAAVIEEAATTVRRTRQKSGGPARGNTTTPMEREAASACEAELRRAGAKSATVKVIATKPGRPADVAIRLKSSEAKALAKVRWARFTPKG